MYGIDEYLLFLDREIKINILEIENNKNISENIKTTYIQTFLQELDNFKEMSSSLKLKKKVENKYSKDINKIVLYNLDNYRYIISKRYNKDILSYYLQLISWYKTSFLCLFQIYSSLEESLRKRG